MIRNTLRRRLRRLIVFLSVPLAAATAVVGLTGAPAQAAYTHVGTFRIFDGAQCLEVSGGGTANGTRVITSFCDFDDNQRWAVFQVTDRSVSYYQIMAYGGAFPLNKCLDAPDNSRFVHIYGCHGGHQQRWATYQGVIRLQSGANPCLTVELVAPVPTPTAIHQTCTSAQFPPRNWTLLPA